MSEFDDRKRDLRAYHEGELSLREVRARSEHRRKVAGKDLLDWEREVHSDAGVARAQLAEMEGFAMELLEKDE